MDVLFLCTGNICRSPMAEAILRARLAERAPDVVVRSAGLRFDGRPAEPHAVKTLAKRGLDLREFRSRIMSSELLEDAALVLGMERLHVREAAVLSEGSFPHTYTLPEFLTSAALFGPRREESLRAWADRIGQLRTPTAHLDHDPFSEVPDPMGRSGRAFRACADQLEGLIDQLVDLAWPVAATPPLPPPIPGGP